LHRKTKAITQNLMDIWPYWSDIALRHDFYEVDYLPENGWVAV
jgi:hypothetical protein